MTTKRNALVGQSGGPTAAINATLCGVVEGCLARPDVFDRIYGMRNGVEGLLNDELVELNDLLADENARTLLCQTPAAALGSCRVKLREEEKFERVFALLEKHNVGAFFYIGGNDSMDAVAGLERYRDAHNERLHNTTRFIGVPKTIDNDLCCTDHTPGFGSAAKYVATLVAEMARDCAVYTTKAVTVIEIMGRDAGWLTAASALAKDLTGDGADLICLPEVPFDAERFIGDVTACLARPEKPYCVVCVSEGIRDKSGDYAAKAAMSGLVDTFGHAYLAGTGKYLENLIREKIGCKCRSVELNIPQRCAAHCASLTDLTEARLVGRAAAEAAAAGKTGRMMGFEREEGEAYAVRVTDQDIAMSAGIVKHVPSAYITPDGRGVSERGLAYLHPLIRGEAPVLYENGLPKFFKI